MANLTTYTPQTASKAREYIAQWQDIERHAAVPTLAGLAVYLRTPQSTLYKWVKSEPEFAEIIAELMNRQESMLIANGLRGAFNPVITRLMLTRHGYSERSHVDISNDPDSEPIEWEVSTVSKTLAGPLPGLDKIAAVKQIPGKLSASRDANLEDSS